MTNIALSIYWSIYLILIFFSLRDIKKMIIVWMPLQFLFNDMVALKFSPPVLTLSIAVNFTLPIIYYFKYRNKIRARNDLNIEKFLFLPIFVTYLLSYFISLVFTIAPLSTIINSTLKEFIRTFLMIFLFYRCINTKDDIRLFVKSAAIVGSMWGMLGIIESVLWDNPIQDFIYLTSPDPTSDIYSNRVYYKPPFIGEGLETRFGIVRAYSFFNIHLAFGRTCLTYSFLILVFLLQKEYQNRKGFLLAALFLLLSGVITCNSKTPILGLFVSCFAFVDFKNKNTARYLLVLLLLVCIVFLLVPQYWDSIISIFDTEKAAEAGGSSVEGRKAQLDVALQLFMQNPLFGNGVGALAAMSKTGVSEGILGAEGWYLSIPPERGIFGCLVYLYMYIYIYIHTKKIISPKIILFLLLGQFTTECVSGLGDMVVYMPIIITIYRYYLLNKRKLLYESRTI